MVGQRLDRLSPRRRLASGRRRFGSSSGGSTTQNRAKVPGYVRLGRDGRRIQPKYEIQFNVINISDKKYYVGGYQNNPNRVLPGQPLTGLMTFHYRF